MDSSDSNLEFCDEDSAPDELASAFLAEGRLSVVPLLGGARAPLFHVHSPGSGSRIYALTARRLALDAASAALAQRLEELQYDPKTCIFQLWGRAFLFWRGGVLRVYAPALPGDTPLDQSEPTQESLGPPGITQLYQQVFEMDLADVTSIYPLSDMIIVVFSRERGSLESVKFRMGDVFVTSSAFLPGHEDFVPVVDRIALPPAPGLGPGAAPRDFEVMDILPGVGSLVVLGAVRYSAGAELAASPRGAPEGPPGPASYVMIRLVCEGSLTMLLDLSGAAAGGAGAGAWAGAYTGAPGGAGVGAGAGQAGEPRLHPGGDAVTFVSFARERPDAVHGFGYDPAWAPRAGAAAPPAPHGGSFSALCVTTARAGDMSCHTAVYEVAPSGPQELTARRRAASSFVLSNVAAQGQCATLSRHLHLSALPLHSLAPGEPATGGERLLASWDDPAPLAEPLRAGCAPRRSSAYSAGPALRTFEDTVVDVEGGAESILRSRLPPQQVSALRAAGCGAGRVLYCGLLRDAEQPGGAGLCCLVQTGDVLEYHAALSGEGERQWLDPLPGGGEDSPLPGSFSVTPLLPVRPGGPERAGPAGQTGQAGQPEGPEGPAPPGPPQPAEGRESGDQDSSPPGLESPETPGALEAEGPPGLSFSPRPGLESLPASRKKGKRDASQQGPGARAAGRAAAQAAEQADEPPGLGPASNASPVPGPTAGATASTAAGAVASQSASQSPSQPQAQVSIQISAPAPAATTQGAPTVGRPLSAKALSQIALLSSQPKPANPQAQPQKKAAGKGQGKPPKAAQADPPAQKPAAQKKPQPAPNPPNPAGTETGLSAFASYPSSFPPVPSLVAQLQLISPPPAPEAYREQIAAIVKEEVGKLLPGGPDTLPALMEVLEFRDSLRATFEAHVQQAIRSAAVALPAVLDKARPGAQAGSLPAQEKRRAPVSEPAGPAQDSLPPSDSAAAIADLRAQFQAVRKDISHLRADVESLKLALGALENIQGRPSPPQDDVVSQLLSRVQSLENEILYPPHPAGPAADEIRDQVCVTVGQILSYAEEGASYGAGGAGGIHGGGGPGRPGGASGPSGGIQDITAIISESQPQGLSQGLSQGFFPPQDQETASERALGGRLAEILRSASSETSSAAAEAEEALAESRRLCDEARAAFQRATASAASAGAQRGATGADIDRAAQRLDARAREAVEKHVDAFLKGQLDSSRLTQFQSAVQLQVTQALRAFFNEELKSHIRDEIRRSLSRTRPYDV